MTQDADAIAKEKKRLALKDRDKKRKLKIAIKGIEREKAKLVARFRALKDERAALEVEAHDNQMVLDIPEEAVELDVHTEELSRAWYNDDVARAIKAVFGVHGAPLPPREPIRSSETPSPANVTPTIIYQTYNVKSPFVDRQGANSQAVADNMHMLYLK